MKFNLISLHMVLFIFALLLNNTFNSSVSVKNDDTISDFITNFAGTPGMEKFIEKSSAFKSLKQPKKTKKKSKKKILRRPKLDQTKLYNKGWLMISSVSFGNTKRFPPLIHPNGDFTIKLDKDKFRINEDYDRSNNQGAPSKRHFWFRLTGRHLYYSANREQINVLDNIYVKHIKYALRHTTFKNLKNCFQIKDMQEMKYNLCANSLKERNRWICLIQRSLGHPQDPICKGKNKGKASSSNDNFIIKTITQPVIIIPQPSANCNEKWDYIGNGGSWECECKEGREQSPINLPPAEKAISSSVKPIFHYESFTPYSPSDFKEGLVKKGDAIKIRYIENALRIYHPNMGKVITLDGSTFIAQEIIFHTPSEHTINGERFDMEMQVIHTGVTQGDIAKNMILSVLFKKKPGYYNKFLDKIDPFNLPNPAEPYREITEDLFIPHVFSNVNDQNISLMKPFSFYTYQGSLTQPPCSQRTILYVASKPLFLSSTTLEMFKESLKMPDMISETGDVQVSNFLPLNFRNTQKLNGRAVFHYDIAKFCGAGLFDDGNNKKVKPKGHFEKKISHLTEYFFVNGENPSGFPGAFVVSEKEAKANR